MTNVLVINGSPRGENSVTLQTCLYMEKHAGSGFRFEYLHAGRGIKALEKDFSPAMEKLAAADVLLFSYPVYTFMAPSQLHRFIELMKASGADFSKKAAMQVTTSKHFYDNTAQRFIEENLRDMGIPYIGGLSADMDDLLGEKGREDAKAFWRYGAHCLENRLFQNGPAAAEARPTEAYTRRFFRDDAKEPGRDVVVVADFSSGGSLWDMVADFHALCPWPVRVVDIGKYPFSGGCLGCFGCAVTGECVYKDGFDKFLRETIQTADATVYAFALRDHSMGARFKMYDDRQFCNGHRTVTQGAPVGYIIEGDISREENLREILAARAQVGGNFLAGLATGAEELEDMTARLSYALEAGYAPPRNFLGVGGMKIFRDLIWVMRGLMKADHKFYKANGVYDDLPQRQRGKVMKVQLLGTLMASPLMKKDFSGKMNAGMLAPYKKALEK